MTGSGLHPSMRRQTLVPWVRAQDPAVSRGCSSSLEPRETFKSLILRTRGTKQPKDYAFQSDWLYTGGSLDKRDRITVHHVKLSSFSMKSIVILLTRSALTCFPVFPKAVSLNSR